MDPDHELVAEFRLNQRVLGKARLELLEKLVEADRERVWATEGYADAAHYLSDRLNEPRGKAKAILRTAYALEELPRLTEALEDGMDLDAVIEIAKKATPATEKALIQRRRELAGC